MPDHDPSSRPAAPVPPDADAPVRLVRVDTRWAERYRRVAHDVAAGLGDALREPGGRLLEVHHVGSTAVAGLLVKPTLDVMARLAVWPPTDGTLARLTRLGFRDHGEAGEPGRRFLSRGGHAEHLHLVAPASDQLTRHVALRELLLRDPRARRRYEEAKRALVDLHRGGRAAYVAGKDALVRALQAEGVDGLPDGIGYAPVRDLLARAASAGVARGRKGGWCLGGGWALALASGGVRRLHDDVDVVLDRNGAETWMAAIARTGVAFGRPGTAEPWRAGDAVPEPPARLLGRAGPLVAPSPLAAAAEPGRAPSWPWFWDVAIEERPDGDWVLRSDPGVTRPLGRAVVEVPLAGAAAPSLPVLAPEVVLVLKARHSGRGPDDPKDRADLAAVAPRLDAGARRWLRTALLRPPAHPWVEALRDG
jgi:GrpB-like predicted nucleotidyltransferase (UPF0157 family)